jgi:outer membrane protein assembly factor BamB
MEPRWFHVETAPHTGLAVGNGVLVYGVRSPGGGGILRALDWSTGEPRWEVTLGAEIISPPVIHQTLGLVYAATDFGEIYAFDLAGEWKWMRTAAETRGVAWGGVTVAPDGSLNIASDGGWLHSLEPSAGRVQVSVDLSQSDLFVRRPAVIGSFVFATGSGGSLHALDRASLTVAWTTRLPSHATSAPLVLEDAGLLFVGEQDGTVQAFTLATGGEVWAWHDGSTVAGLASDGDQVYAALTSGRVVALDPRSGSVAWSTEAGGALSTPPLTDGDHVLLASESGELIYLEADTGEESTEMRLWVGEGILGAPSPAGGWLFVPAQSGVLAYGPPG